MLRHFHKIIVLSCIFGVFFFSFSFGKVYSQEKTNFSLVADPAFQEVELGEDQNTAEAVILFKNQSDVAQQIELFAYDFKQTDHFGSIALLKNFSGDYLHTLASFLSFEKDSLIIYPHSEEKVVVRINDRQSLSPGGHYAAVIARAVDKNVTSQQKVLPAISSLLLIRKTGGERIHLSLDEIEWGFKAIIANISKKMVLVFKNEGNVHVIPRGTVEIKDTLGRLVYQGIVNDSSLYLLPGTKRKISVTLQQSRWVLPVTFLFVEVSGRSDVGDAVFSSEISYFYVDWKFIVLLIIIASLRIIKVRKNLKKRKDEKEV